MTRLMIVEDTYEYDVAVRRPVHIQTWETDEDMECACHNLNQNTASGIDRYLLVELDQ